MNPFFKSLLIPGLLLLGACAGEKPVVLAPEPPPVIKATLGDVFFDFDKIEIREEAIVQLKTNYQWLTENPSQKVMVEGNCDERGTNEYNLALGERRASSAKSFLVNLGADPVRINTVSFGEEKPFDQGHNEEAWAKNRRDHFIAQ